jgi:uncharacterized membrane protein YphA (DoxX/SURF4 family)
MEAEHRQGKAGFATGAHRFVCALALAHFTAFASFWVQARGLVGPSGILPAGQYFAAARAQLGNAAWYDLPSFFWILGTGRAIGMVCALGLVLSVLVFFRIARAPCLILMWACYLSLMSVGQVFFDFQWDTLLLECSLVAVFLVPWTLGRAPRDYDPPTWGRYVAWWLLFRLMFFSGLVKLTSGDPTWRHLLALTFHYQTQPLPSPLAWYAHQLPVWFQEASCAVMFAIELLAPLCLIAGRRARHGAALWLIFLQVVIALTGNYAFFNLLSIGLCLTCLDDAWWQKLHLRPAGPAAEPASQRSRLMRAKPTLVRWFAAFYFGLTFFVSVTALFRGMGRSEPVVLLERVIGPWESFNTYGLFAVMTTERPELIIEGSDDQRDWREYGLPYKPGDLARRPRWVAPYQPRLDWQLWFAALEPSESNPWVGTLCEKLLRNDPAVLGLFAANPFPGHAPHYIRVVRYQYEFTDAAERRRTGNWWRRSPLDFYIGPVELPSTP